jgi:hypothetical protein
MDPQQSKAGMDRRRFLRNAAAVGWGVPVMLTLMSSPAAAQGVGTICGTRQGNVCTQTAPCLTGLVCRRSDQDCRCQLPA